MVASHSAARTSLLSSPRLTARRSLALRAALAQPRTGEPLSSQAPPYTLLQENQTQTTSLKEPEHQTLKSLWFFLFLRVLLSIRSESLELRQQRLFYIVRWFKATCAK
jgi:hypothetical protein